MRGYDDLNFPAFDEAAETLRKQGWTVFNPADHDRKQHIDPDKDWVRAMAWDLRMVTKVDAIVLLPGWQKSEGALLEYQVASGLKLKVYAYHKDEDPVLRPVSISYHPSLNLHPVLDNKVPYSDVDLLKPGTAAQINEYVNRQARTFDTGATRDTDEGKLDPEGFLSPLVIRRFSEYMHDHRVQSDGALRDSGNWQRGIPKDAYMKSMWRHFLDVWAGHRGYNWTDQEEALCALLFNVQGMLFEVLRES
jgi:hypothetical protein